MQNKVIGVVAFVLGLSAVALAERPERAATGKQGHVMWTAERGEWMSLPDIFPRGGTMKVIQGDPSRGPSDLYMRFPAGYVTPWHFHSPTERLYVDKGKIQFEMMNGESRTLGEGGFVMVPGRMAHRASCTGDDECTFYLSSGGPFDVHLVDEKGNVTRSWSAAEPAKGTRQQPPQQRQQQQQHR